MKAYDSVSGELVYSFFAFDSRFTGGVRVATADVNGDGIPDIICAAGPGGGPEVRVFDGRSGQPLAGPLGRFLAFDPNFTGGASVAAGDVNGDGFADVIVGADTGGGPNVIVYSGKDGSVLYDFFAFDRAFTGGVRVAAGDVNGDGKADIIVGAGPGGGPNVVVLSGADGSVLRNFFAYDQNLTGGVSVAAGDTNGDGKADVLVGSGPGTTPDVTIFSAAEGAMLLSFCPGDPSFGGGICVGYASQTSRGRPGIMTTTGRGGSPQVCTFDPLTGTEVDQFFSYDPLFRGGVYVGGTG